MLTKQTTLVLSPVYLINSQIYACWALIYLLVYGDLQSAGL